jgi:hypothetical protein
MATRIFFTLPPSLPPSLPPFSNSKNDLSNISGHILVDGHPRDEGFNAKIGYVEQDDQLMGIMTVRAFPPSLPPSLRPSRSPSLFERKSLVKN